ncbi:MAG: tail fiber protein [Bacteroidales bacterium]|nr:tail fiber protein [Bacteroidales bacterium]
MDEAYIGTVLLFGGNFAPRNWAFCDGQLISINSNQALFSILGTTYGGDGRTTFGLPDLRGRAALSAGQGPGLTNRHLGEKSGTETVTLSTNELPAHSHIASGAIMAKEEADIDDPTGHYIAGTGNAIFGTSSDIAMNANSVDVQIENNGGGQAHYNMQPYLCLNYIICTHGLFPPRS